MRRLRSRNLDRRNLDHRNFDRKNLAVAATLAAALLAAPLAVGASRALATSEGPVAAALRVGPADAAPAQAVAPAMTSGPEAAPACPRKVRVVYGGYGTPEGCAAR